MRKLLIILFLTVCSFLSNGQTVSAPDPKSFLQSTTGQDASGFSLSGFSGTATLLTSISLVNPPSGTTFYLGTSSGLTASSGFTLSGNKTRLVFTGTMSSINTALASLKINTGSIKGDINISVAATVNQTGYYYNGVNGHFYKPVPTGSTFSGAITAAHSSTFKGQTGYLVTITSADEDAFIYANVPQGNIWFAADDRTTEGRWVISDGPEAGTLLKTSNGQYNGNVQGVYNNWASGEPNDWGGNEDAAVTKWSGGSQWNDLAVSNVNPYVIEYGTWTNPDNATFTEFYSNSVTHSNGESLKALFNFNFNSNIDKTKFSAQVFKRNDESSSWTPSDGYKALNGLGKVYLSNQLDTAKVYSTAIQLASGTSDMTAFSTADIGKIYKLTTTGSSGGGWGTDIYTNDSYIPAMAVHAGVLTIGQTKEIYIKVVEGQNNYPGTTRNGITTSEWGSWGLSYQFVSNPISYKATISPGGAEWSYVNPNASWLGSGVSRLLIDMREIGSLDPSKISNVKILDAYDGPVTFLTNDGTWAQYSVPSPLTKVTDGTSAYNQYIRNVNGTNTDYAFTCGVGFTQQGAFKQHKMMLQDYDSAQLRTLYNSIVTVTDVYLAFKELANGGIFGNQTGNEFTYGIQYKNADIDENGVFNEADCFRLLQNLTGAQNIVSNYTLDNTIKLIPDSVYNSIGKSNWNSFASYTGKEYSFSLKDGVINYSYDLAVSWKGDVNLSHSPTPPSNGITTSSIRTMAVKSMSVSNEVQASIITEIVSDKVYAYITFDPLQQEVVGTQFQLDYDNSLLKFEGVEFKTKGNPMNYGTNKGTYINVGSLSTDGNSTLDNTTEYKIIFSLNKTVPNILGLIGISNTDAVNKSGSQLKIKIN